VRCRLFALFAVAAMLAAATFLPGFHGGGGPSALAETPPQGSLPTSPPGSVPTPAPRPTPTTTPRPTPTPAPTPSPGPHVYNIPASIAADCSREVSAAIATWIASVPDNSTLVFGRNACYRTERPIEVSSRNDLVFVGNGATFRRFDLSPEELQYPYGNRHLYFTGGRNITVRNLRIQGVNTVSDDPDHYPGFGSYRGIYEFAHALSFHTVQGVVVEDVTIDAVYGDGVYFGGRSGPNSNVRVSRVIIDRNGRQGIALVNVNGALIEDVQFLHSRRSGFDFEPNPGMAALNVEIRRTYIRSRLLPFASGGRSQVAGIYLHDNVIDSDSVPWVYVRAVDGTRRHDWRVWDNQVLRELGSPMAGLYFVNVDNVDIRRNVSHVSPLRSRKAVEFQNAHGGLYVIGNDFTGACEPYVADSLTTAVYASGNILSTNCPLYAR
jgi:hypothetical protein